MRSKAATLRGAPMVAPADRAEVDLSVLEQMVGFHVHMFDLAMYQSFYERFAERGFTPAIFSTLAVIRQNPGIRHGASPTRCVSSGRT